MQCGSTDKLLQATPGRAAVLPWGEIIVGLTTEPNKVLGSDSSEGHAGHPHTVEEIDTWMSAPTEEAHEAPMALVCQVRKEG
jgi:hypothetical protein